MHDTDLLAALHAVKNEAADHEGVHFDPCPLRWLDAALWMNARK